MEAHHFEMHKHVLEYDDVMNRQREIIYGQRRQILGGVALTAGTAGLLGQLSPEAASAAEANGGKRSGKARRHLC